MSVLQRLLHREAARSPHMLDAAPVNGGADRSLAPDTAAEDDLQGYTEMPTLASQLAEGGVPWAPECGTPCYSKAHHHDHQ